MPSTPLSTTPLPRSGLVQCTFRDTVIPRVQSTICYTACMATITIPKKLAANGDLVVIPKRELDAIIERADNGVSERDVLQWAREARRLGKAGKLLPLAALRKA
jgi:hypothetical protein